MRYSATNIFFGNDAQAGWIYDLSMNFSDPLTLNTASFFITRSLDEYTLVGASYSNSQYFVDLSLLGYGVVQQGANAYEDERRYGLFASATLPFLHQGYLSGDLCAAFFQDYQTNSQREPLSATLSLRRYERFGVSLYPHFELNAQAYALQERDTQIFGAQLTYTQGLDKELYMTLRGKYSKSDTNDFLSQKGVKLVRDVTTVLQDGDPSAIIMPSLLQTLYLKKASKLSVELKKVFNADAYFFTFPLSLRRESLVVGYNNYEVSGSTKTLHNDEYKAAILFDTLLLNTMSLPLTLEYRYNTNETLTKMHTVRFLVGMSF
jgi:hypothetical protein